MYFGGGGGVFHWCICLPHPTLPLSKNVPRWLTDTGSKYNFATENDQPDLSGCGNVYGHARSTYAGIDIVRCLTTASGANRK